MKGYKVVYDATFDDDFSGPIGIQFVSYSLSADKAIYIPGEKTVPRPGNGPLAVFDTFEHALAFLGKTTLDYPVAIWECEWTPSEHFSLWYRVMDSVFNGPITYPEGTCFASSVTLTKRVDC